MNLDLIIGMRIFFNHLTCINASNAITNLKIFVSLTFTWRLNMNLDLIKGT